MFAVRAVHDSKSKSKSTQLLCKELALACLPCKNAEIMEGAKVQLFENVDSRKSSDTTLAEEFRVVHLSKSESDFERRFSVDSTASLCSNWVQEFNKTLPQLANEKVYTINTPEKLKQLLEMHESRNNPMPSADEMFPYLHGPPSLRGKVYFDNRFDPETELDFLSEDTESIALRYPPESFAKAPDVGFHVMTINSQADENPCMVNSAVIEDLLFFRESQEGMFDAEHLHLKTLQQFEDFDGLSNKPSNPLAQTNRNYKLQIKMMAPMCHFLVYNNDMNMPNNIEVARVLNYLRGLDLTKSIYVVDFDAALWREIGGFYIPTLKPGQTKETTSKEASKEAPKASEVHTQPLQLSSLEQNLIWLIYSISQLFPRLYVGNVLSFKQLISNKEKASQYDFQLYIYCHEKAPMPTLAALRQILQDLHAGDNKKAIFVEFSDALLRHASALSKEQTLSYLNLLRVINIIVNKSSRNVFVYSYDGFTSTSLLLLGLGLFWGCDHTEEVAMCLFRNPGVKFHLCPGDFSFVKNLEVYVQWFKRQPAKDSRLLVELPLDKIYASYRPYNRPTDWFRNDGEINFPAFIYESLLLGSVSHASSLAVLAALHVTKVISIGEKPRWYAALNCTFSHEASGETKGPVLEPIFRFNNGRSLVYEVKVTSPAMRAHLFKHGAVPQLKSFVYIHGVEDDGRDSMYPLMAQCPEWVQNKVLVSPRDTEKTLVHCRIGVSRLATLAIASVMKHFQMSLVESFLYVRVRRFNVVIQPNLRLFYELFLYEEHLQALRLAGERPTEARVCWWTLCAEIHRLNQQYTE